MVPNLSIKNIFSETKGVILHDLLALIIAIVALVAFLFSSPEPIAHKLRASWKIGLESVGILDNDLISRYLYQALMK